MVPKPKWTPKKAKCIELLAVGQMTQAQIADQLRVNAKTICKWKSLPGFMDEVISRAQQLLKQDVPEVYSALSNHSKGGNDRHIKIFLEHIEKLETIRAGRASITFTWEPPTNTGESDE